MQLYDQFNRPIKQTKKPEPQRLAAAPLLDSWREYVAAGLTPQNLASILKDADAGDVRRQSELFAQIEEKDAHILGEKAKRQNVILDVKFNITPATEDKRDVKVADFISEYFENMTDYEDVLISLQDAIGKGFSALEIDWDMSEGQALPDKLDFIEQKRFLFTDPNGILRRYPLLLSDEDLMGAEIPAWKVLLHIYGGKSGQATRSGIYRVCAWMYLFKNYAIKDWVAFCEVYGMPLRLGKYDSNANEDDRNALLTAIQSLGSDAAGIISKDTEIEFIESARGKSSGELYQELADFANRENSKAILGQTLSAEVGKTGSYAAAKIHEGVRIDLLKADSRAIASVIRRQLIRPIVGFNFGWDTLLPKYEADWKAPEDLKRLSEVYKNLVEFGQPIALEHVSERFGVPLPEDGETVLQKQVPEEKQVNAKRIIAKTTTGDAVEEIAKQLDKKAAQPMNALIEPFRDLLAASNSLLELKNKIFDLYPDMDPVALGTVMERAMVAAELLGRFEVE